MTRQRKRNLDLDQDQSPKSMPNVDTPMGDSPTRLTYLDRPRDDSSFMSEPNTLTPCRNSEAAGSKRSTDGTRTRWKAIAAI